MKETSVLSILVFAVLVLQATANFTEKTNNKFLKISEKCYVRVGVPAVYRGKFNSFFFADEPVVHRYVQCLWTDLGLWNDETGFDSTQMAEMYRDRSYKDSTKNILNDCNESSRREPASKWCFHGFQCILKSRIGQWFKKDVGLMTTDGTIEHRYDLIYS